MKQNAAKPPLVRRTEITQATLDRFIGKSFAYGRADCVQMAAFHLKAMGHTVLLSKGGQYRSALGAGKAIRRAGYASLAEALDAMGLERIPPAAALPGDIIAIPTAAKLECLMIVLGNGRALGWVDEVPEASVLQPVMYETGWRVPCLKR
jgi:hypothetical protein